MAKLAIYDFLLVLNSNYGSISNGLSSIEEKHVLTKISRGIRLHSGHIVSATGMSINPRDGTYMYLERSHVIRQVLDEDFFS